MSKSTTTKKAPKTTKTKPSGVEWLGDIPEHWEVLPLRAFLELKSERNHPDAPVLSVYREYGVILKDSRDDNHNSTSSDTSNYKVVYPSDLVINKMKAWQGSLGVSQYHGIVSPAYITCKVSPKLNGKYLHYLLRSKPLIGALDSISYGVRIGQWDMRYDDFKKIEICQPPKPEQDKIVAFLDRKTAQIDALIEKKQRLLKLLDEQLAIKINNAVTKGIVNAQYGTLNPHLSTKTTPIYTTHTSPLKNSGIEWIGEIPEEWKVNRFKFHISPLEQGWSPQCDNRPAKEGKWAVIKVGCVNYSKFRPEEHKTIPPNIKPRLDLRIKPGDFLISRANSRELVGSAAIATESKWKLMLCDKVYRCSVKDESLLPALAINILGANFARKQIEIGANGASDSMQNISQDVLKNLTFALAPCSEQNVILDYIQKQLLYKNKQSKITNHEILALQNLATSLISQTVTGNLK